MERARPLIRFLLRTNLRVSLEFGLWRSGSAKETRQTMGFSCLGYCYYLAHIAYLRHNVYTFDTFIAISPLHHDSTLVQETLSV